MCTQAECPWCRIDEQAARIERLEKALLRAANKLEEVAIYVVPPLDLLDEVKAAKSALGGEEQVMPNDTELLNWLESYWRKQDDVPISFHNDGFIPEFSGTYARGMTLREALELARLKSREDIDDDDE